jgi:hypothetical protein
MYNQRFLKTIENSFEKFLKTHARSNEKLKILHGNIKNDLLKKFKEKNIDGIEVIAIDKKNKSEDTAKGRYYNKKVDISIRKNGKIIGAVAVKFVMNNYLQNANNYFESMLGETANLRTANLPYFQMLIMFDRMPYFKKKGMLSKWEKITETHINKYINLSKDNINDFFHSPNLTLFSLISLPKKIVENEKINSKQTFKNEILKLMNNNQFELKFSDLFNNDLFEKNVIYNDYDKFLDRIIYYFLYNGDI